MSGSEGGTSGKMKKDTDVLARLKEKANIFNNKRYKKVRTPSRSMRRRFSFKKIYKTKKKI